MTPKLRSRADKVLLFFICGVGVLGVEFGVWRVMVGFLSYVVVGIFRVIKFHTDVCCCVVWLRGKKF